mmetsp:Transcript_36498/g.88453  ORF Transcript_36498/g.88453 Transcript_36498/m.88453 type:complete len:500 (-) Transcript_36498:746-2245(-)
MVPHQYQLHHPMMVALRHPIRPHQGLCQRPHPQKKPVEYDFLPPSTEDCQAFHDGKDVAGEDDMDVRNFEVELEVSLPVATSVDLITSAVVDATGDVLLPELVGCVDNNRRSRRLQSRQLNVNRYAIANVVEMTGSAAAADECTPGTSDFCYAVVLKMDLAIKSSEINDLVIMSLLSDVFNGGDMDLVDRLSLDDYSFRSVKVTRIAPTQPTLAPSKRPTMPPVDWPTSAPVTSAPTKTQTTPTKRPTLRPTALDYDDDECGANCSGNQSCQGGESIVEIGCGACIGDYSCIGLRDILIGDAACAGEYSCAYLHDTAIGDNSCVAPYSCACLEKGQEVVDNSCRNAGDCCTETGEPLNVPTSSCTAAEDCVFASGPIGTGSCTGGSRTCWKSKAVIGDNSCNDGGCTALHGDVADNSCNGARACPIGSEDLEVLIAQGSCNCDGCCACLTEPSTLPEHEGVIFVPPQSCNDLAPNDQAIDYDVSKLSRGDGSPTYCCSE